MLLSYIDWLFLLFIYRNTTGVTEEALKEFSMMFKWAFYLKNKTKK